MPVTLDDFPTYDSTLKVDMNKIKKFFKKASKQDDKALMEGAFKRFLLVQVARIGLRNEKVSPAEGKENIIWRAKEWASLCKEFPVSRERFVDEDGTESVSELRFGEEIFGSALITLSVRDISVELANPEAFGIKVVDDSCTEEGVMAVEQDDAKRNAEIEEFIKTNEAKLVSWGVKWDMDTIGQVREWLAFGESYFGDEGNTDTLDDLIGMRTDGGPLEC